MIGSIIGSKFPYPLSDTEPSPHAEEAQKAIEELGSDDEPELFDFDEDYINSENPYALFRFSQLDEEDSYFCINSAYPVLGDYMEEFNGLAHMVTVIGSISELVEQAVIGKINPLHVAVKRDDVPMAKLVMAVSRGKLLKWQDSQGKTPFNLVRSEGMGQALTFFKVAISQIEAAKKEVAEKMKKEKSAQAEKLKHQEVTKKKEGSSES